MISIGIDVHKIKCVATIKKESRKKLEQTSFDNTTHGIMGFIKHIKKTYGDDDVQAVCESTANYWIRLHDTLEDNGIDTILAHPAKTKIIAQARLKNDKLDSSILADLLRSDMIYESFVPQKYYRDLRSMVRTRLGLVRNISRHKNKIYAILAKYDYTVPTKTFSKKRLQWLHEITLSEIDRMAMNAYVESIEMTQKQVNTFETKIAEISNEDSRTRLLMTIPGINYVTTLTIISEIVDINRFATAEKLVSYAGLAPSHRDSADVHRGGGITKRGSTWLRNAMVRLPPQQYDMIQE